MSQERFEVGKQPHVEITECMGDLVVRSWAETAVLIKGDEYETEGGLTITSQGSIRLTVPEASNLVIQTVHGDVEIKRIEGTVSLQTAYADATIRGAGSLKIGTIHSDLAVKQVEGGVSVETVFGDTAVRNCADLSLGTIHGDLMARAVDGMVNVVEVYGDISLRGIGGNVSVQQGSRDANLRGLRGENNNLSDIAGDIRLHGPLSPGQHRFTANGDIVLHWPEHEPVMITAVTPKFTSRIQFDELTEQDDDSYTARIGSEGPTIALEADGRIIVKEMEAEKAHWSGDDIGFDFDFDFDFEGFSEKINEEVFAQVSRITNELENKFGPDFAESMAEKFARKAERETAKVERAAERAMRQAERAMRDAEKKMQQTTRFKPPAPPRPPTSPAAAGKAKKVSSEEQLKILKMVEKGIISPEEAGTLLEALEN